MIWDFLGCSKYLGVSNIKNNWFWEWWSRPLGPNTMKKGFSGFPKMTPKSYISENEAT